MDAKYNWLIDNGAVRVTLNVVAFALWIAMAVGLRYPAYPLKRGFVWVEKILARLTCLVL
jgi:hypothetical protein